MRPKVTPMSKTAKLAQDRFYGRPRKGCPKGSKARELHSEEGRYMHKSTTYDPADWEGTGLRSGDGPWKGIKDLERGRDRVLKGLGGREPGYESQYGRHVVQMMNLTPLQKKAIKSMRPR